MDKILKELREKLKSGIRDYDLLNSYDYMNDYDIIPMYDDRRIPTQWQTLESNPKHKEQKLSG